MTKRLHIMARGLGMAALAVLVLSCPYTLRAAGDPATAALLGKVERAAAAISSFRSEFIQERRLSLFAEPVIFHGSLTVVRPDKLRWEFTRPVPSALIFNGRVGLRCSDRAEPARFSLDGDPIMRTVAEQLWLWLGGDYGRLADGYELHGEGAELRVIPKDSKTREYVEEVRILFDEATLRPKQVLIAEPGGDSTTLRFTATEEDGPVDHRLFEACAQP